MACTDGSGSLTASGERSVGMRLTGQTQLLGQYGSDLCVYDLRRLVYT